MYVDTINAERISVGDGLGKTTDDGGEIFNLYEDTTVSGYGTAPKNKASKYSHAEGVSTQALGQGSHAEGAGTLVTGAGSHAEGRGINFSVNVTEISDNIITVVSNNSSITELNAIKKNAVVWYEKSDSTHNGEFYYVTAAELSEFMGIPTGTCKITLDKAPSFSTGTNLTVIMGGALSYISHVEGNYNNAVDIEATNLYGNEGSDHQRQHAEGSRTLALGYAAHSEGELTLAKGNMSHAEGKDTIAAGSGSHAEGEGTDAIGYLSHAEGGWTEANGEYSHAEGYTSKANGKYSHAEGNGTKAKGNASHAGGLYTIAEVDSSIALGEYNIPTRTLIYTFKVSSMQMGSGIVIRIGNFTGSRIDKVMSLYNPILYHNGKAITNPLTNEYFKDVGKDTNESRCWNFRHGSNKPTVETTVNDYILLRDDVTSASSSSGLYYKDEDKNLEIGTYVLAIQGFGAIEDLPTVEVLYNNTDIMGEYTRDMVSGILTIGNGTEKNVRGNAFEVYNDGHAEIQTMGDSYNSVATKEYIDNKIAKLEAAIRALGGIIE